MTDQHDKAELESYRRTGIAVARAVERLQKRGFPRGEIGMELMTHAIALLVNLPVPVAREQAVVYLETFVTLCQQGEMAEAAAGAKH